MWKKAQQKQVKNFSEKDRQKGRGCDDSASSRNLHSCQ